MSGEKLRANIERSKANLKIVETKCRDLAALVRSIAANVREGVKPGLDQTGKVAGKGASVAAPSAVADDDEGDDSGFKRPGSRALKRLARVAKSALAGGDIADAAFDAAKIVGRSLGPIGIAIAIGAKVLEQAKAYTDRKAEEARKAREDDLEQKLQATQTRFEALLDARLAELRKPETLSALARALVNYEDQGKQSGLIASHDLTGFGLGGE